MRYLQAENLKFRRTFSKKLVWLFPVFTVLLSILSGNFFQLSALNWWYTTMLPGVLTILCALADQKDGKKLGYRTIYALPVSLKKAWRAKVCIAGLYSAASTLVLVAATLLFGLLLLSDPLPAWRVLAGGVLMIVTTLWQIPLCLFLSRKIGVVGTVFLNTVLAIFLGVLCSTKTFWWICPYSWSVRLMTPVLGILPNGLVAQSGDPLLNPSAVPVGVALSLVLLAVLLIVTERWFRNREAG